MSGWWRAPLAEVVAGRPAVVAGGPAAFWTDLVPVVRAAGARDVLVVATDGRGAGPQPDAACVVVDAVDDTTDTNDTNDTTDDTMARIRASVRALDDPPEHVVEAIEMFDPERSAVVFGSFLAEAPALAGRPLVAHRRPEWVALEDKIRLAELLDRAGVARSPSRVVDVDRAAGVWRELDGGDGTVWAGDARDGYHGGGALTRWVTDDAEAADVAATLARRCDLVRIMPYLPGIATSIHGIVMDDGVVALRPVELVCLRRSHELRYSGCATFWDPPGEVRAEMRGAARRLGALLRDEFGFRGAFTLDGVATTEGFRPTELNPRFGAGLGVITRGLADLPLHLVLDLVVAGVPLPLGAAELERTILGEADARRSGATWQLHVDTPVAVENRAAVYDAGEWRWAAPGEPADGALLAGAGFARLAFESDRTPVGPSVGERSAAVWRFAESELGMRIGPLTAPVDVTRPP